MTDADEILALEHAALDRWTTGDPSGYLEICGSDVTYLDNTVERRLDGLEALADLYEAVRGKIHADRYEMLSPNVQLCGDAAVLTYNFVGYVHDNADRWNCTQVYCRADDRWRIVHTHWSPTHRS